jgi:hypothetical protein
VELLFIFVENDEMKIDITQLQRWNRLRSQGDIARLAELSGFHYNTVANAFRDRKASPLLISFMERYFAARERELAGEQPVS